MMSTRSGKRIHNSFHESVLQDNVELAVKRERKTRSKRFKENVDSLNLTIITLKKRNNYVSYPTDDELADDTDDKEVKNSSSINKSLKEHNFAPAVQHLEGNTDVKKYVRLTRRTKKLTENLAEDSQDTGNHYIDTSKKSVSKKNKKKNNNSTESVNSGVPNKNKSKKKKGWKSDAEFVENIYQDEKDMKMNRSNLSADSFYSVADGPVHNENLATNISPIKMSDIASNDSRLDNLDDKQKPTFDGNFIVNEAGQVVSGNMNDSSDDKMSFSETLSESTDSIIYQNINGTFVNEIRRHHSGKKILTLEGNAILGNKNTTVHKETELSKSIDSLKRKSSINNATFEKDTEISTDEAIFKENNKSSTDKISNESALDPTKNIKGPLNKESPLKSQMKMKKSSIIESIGIVPNDSPNKRKSANLNSILEKEMSTKNIAGAITAKQSPLKLLKTKRKSSIKDVTFDERSESASASITDMTFENESSLQDTSAMKQISSIKNSTFDKDPETGSKIIVDTTFEKECTPKKSDIKKRKSSIKDSTFDKDLEAESKIKVDTTFEKECIPQKSDIKKRKSSIKDSTFDKDLQAESKIIVDTTFEKECIPQKSDIKKKKSSIKDSTFDKNFQSECKIIMNTTFEKESTSQLSKTRKRKSSIKDCMFDKDKNSTQSGSKIITDTTFETESIPQISETKKRKSLIKDTMFDKESNSMQNNVTSLNATLELKYKRKSNINGNLDSTYDKSSPTTLDTTFEKDTKLDITFDKNSKSSIISSDQSNVTDDEVSRISITSDDSNSGPDKTSSFNQSEANIMNTTPVLIESSMDESLIQKHVEIGPVTPLKREGTFTKEGPEVTVTTPKTSPMKRMSLPSPGCTPFPQRISNKDKPVLNVTRSIEKDRRSSLVQPVPRTTKVMFCSPVNNPVVVMQNKRKVIKSNLKGSNKSFVFEERECGGPATRKRSYTHGDAGEARSKRTRLAPPHHQPRPLPPLPARVRTCSAAGKLQDETTPEPASARAGGRLARTKLPDFASLHQKQFDKMESLDQCQERKAKRARQLLTPTGAVAAADRTSPQGSVTESRKLVKETSKKTDTPTKSLPTLDSLNPGYTRFGFKLNLDVNPFSIPCKNTEGGPRVAANGLKRQVTLPSLAGGTTDRREAAKRVVMREKSFTDKRRVNKNENRTIIKGVRTNRRFELQMKLRNLDQGRE